MLFLTQKQMSPQVKTDVSPSEKGQSDQMKYGNKSY
jgi:hypothetical protein